eukprot:scaffold7395_cov175-Amphora_coffeaeformis.AAC.2
MSGLSHSFKSCSGCRHCLLQPCCGLLSMFRGDILSPVLRGNGRCPSLVRSIDQQRCLNNEGYQHSRCTPILLSVFFSQWRLFFSAGSLASIDGTFFSTG